LQADDVTPTQATPDTAPVHPAVAPAMHAAAAPGGATGASARPSRAVLTIATGKWVYLDMAIALARSFLWWHRGSDIEFQIATDITGPLPADMAGVTILRFQPGELGHGFSMKLKLDQLATADQTLFIDADCLCMGRLDSVFERFAGHAVSVVGSAIDEGEWFGDVARTCAQFDVPAIPKFNGGVYFIERGELASRVYARARSLEEHYDAIGLVRLRGSPNEELLMAISMAIEGCSGIEDDGSIHGELFASPQLLAVDVLRGHARLRNPPPSDREHRPGYPVREISPVIVHFLGDFTRKWRYRGEEKALRLVSLHGLPAPLARAWTNLSYRWPAMCLEWLRDTLRPAYRRLFGLRAVRPSDRV
jgi:hypothetical protein